MILQQKFLSTEIPMSQYWTTFVVNIFTMNFGVVEGWASPSLLLLTSDDTPLESEKLTMEEASWVTSLVSLGALIGNICFGILTNHFGRKICLTITIIPLIVSWLLILLVRSVSALYAARFLGGAYGGAVYVIVPLFVSEIADDSIRGTLGSIFPMFESLGMLLAFIIGGYLQYHVLPIAMILLTIISMILLYSLPEPALVLIKHGKKVQAQQSIRFYKNIPESDQKLVDLEILNIQRILYDNREGDGGKKTVDISDMLTGVGRKSLTLGIILSMLNVGSGVFAISGYSSNMFEETGSNLSPNMSTIVIGVIQFLASFITMYLVDRSGRKIIFVVSGVGTALGLIVLGVYMMAESLNLDTASINWIPLVSLSWTFLISAVGIAGLTTTVLTEIMPETIKEAGVTFCEFILLGFGFVNLKFLPLLIETFSFHGSMFLFAGFSLCLTIYLIIFMPETRGKTNEQIMKSFR